MAHNSQNLCCDSVYCPTACAHARSWLETAASSGSWKPSAALGSLAQDAKDTTADPEAAYNFQGVILQGCEPAKHLLLDGAKRLGE